MSSSRRRSRWAFPGSLARTLGVIGLLCTLLYAVPRTSVLGAILLTGYLGGAIREPSFGSNDPIFTHTLFGLYLGLLAWGGLGPHLIATTCACASPYSAARGLAARPTKLQRQPSRSALWSTTTKSPDFVISRVLDAPRELVWKCFTDPEHMKRWWGPRASR